MAPEALHRVLSPGWLHSSNASHSRHAITRPTQAANLEAQLSAAAGEREALQQRTAELEGQVSTLLGRLAWPLLAHAQRTVVDGTVLGVPASTQRSVLLR